MKVFQDRDRSAGAKRQKCREDIALQLRGLRLAQRKTEPIGYGQGAWWSYLLGDLRHHAERRGDDSLVLELRLDQTDRLVAHWSHRHQQGDIDLVCQQQLRDLRRRLAREPARCRDRAHQGNMTGGYVADDSGRGKLVSAIQR